MTAASPTLDPSYSLTLRVRVPNGTNVLAAIVAAIRKLGLAVGVGAPIKETPTFAIQEMIVSCRELPQCEAVLKAVRTVDGAEVMNFSISR